MGVEIALGTGESVLWALAFFCIGVGAMYLLQNYRFEKKLARRSKLESQK